MLIGGNINATYAAIAATIAIKHCDISKAPDIVRMRSELAAKKRNMMVNRYEKEPLGELTIANYDMLARERTKPRQLNLFDEKLTDERIKEEILNELEK